MVDECGRHILIRVGDPLRIAVLVDEQRADAFGEILAGKYSSEARILAHQTRSSEDDARAAAASQAPPGRVGEFSCKVFAAVCASSEPSSRQRRTMS